MISGFGYPQLLKRVGEIITDIKTHGAIDHFFVCLDAEEEPPETRLRIVEQYIVGNPSKTPCHIIIHNCWIETWFLGNGPMMRRNPQSEKLRKWKAFYDVSRDCPEFMTAFASYRIRAQFHEDYLEERLLERGLRYSKKFPGPVQEEAYLRSLVERHEQTSHLQSFGRLLTLWRSLGGNI